MSDTPTRPPRHVADLRKRAERLAGGDVARSTAMVRNVATIAIAQMLPPSAIKGGTAMKLRLGLEGSRFSTDVDLARRDDLDAFLADYAAALHEGWGGFTGEIRPNRSIARPRGVPADYIMVSRDLKVRYLSKDLLTLLLEIGHDELGDTIDPPAALSSDISPLFAALGLPEPSPVRVVAHDHQIAQKIHAVSAPGSDRAHDLVDLQLLEATCPFDDRRVGTMCKRLFASRRAHPWPPPIELGTNWESLYAASAVGLNVVADAGSAVAWVAAYVARLDIATDGTPG